MSLNILNSNKKIITSINKKSSRKAKILPQFSISSENKPLLDLLEIQRKSFFDFLQHGIPDELAKTTVFRETAKNSTCKQELELKFNPETYKFISPNFTPKEAILNGKTYACKVYVQATLLIRSPYNTQKATARGIFQKEPNLVTRKSNHSLASQSFAFLRIPRKGKQSRNLPIITSNTDSSQLRKSKVNKSVKALLAAQSRNSSVSFDRESFSKGWAPPSSFALTSASFTNVKYREPGSPLLCKEKMLAKQSVGVKAPSKFIIVEGLGVDVRNHGFELPRNGALINRHLLQKSHSPSKTKILAKHDFSFAAAPLILQNKFIEYLSGTPENNLFLMRLGLCRRKASGLLSYANFVLRKSEVQSKKGEPAPYQNQFYGVQNWGLAKLHVRVAKAYLHQCWIPLSKTLCLPLLSKNTIRRSSTKQEENNLLGRKLGEEANLQVKVHELATTSFKLDTPNLVGVINEVERFLRPSVFDSLSLPLQVQSIKRQRKSTRIKALNKLFYPKEYKASPYSFFPSHLLQNKGLHAQPVIPTKVSINKVNEYTSHVKNTRTSFEEIVSYPSVKTNLLGIPKSSFDREPFSTPSLASKILAKQAEKHGFADPFKVVQSEEAIRQNILLGSKKLVVDKKKGDLSDIQVFRPWIFLGELPLMTKRGHFILNGSPRVIVNQIARCPGIYFQEKRRGVGIEQEIRVSADLIPQRGPWLRIQSDWEGRFWARLKQEGRVKYATLYEAFQEFEKEYNPPLICLLSNSYPTNTSNLSTSNPLQSTGGKIKTSTSSLFSKSENVTFQERKIKEDRQKKALIRLFKNPARYSLGKLGRSRVNERIHNSFTRPSNPPTHTASINYIDNALTNRKSVLEIMYASCPYPSEGSFSFGSERKPITRKESKTSPSFLRITSHKVPLTPTDCFASEGGADSLSKEAEELNKAVKGIPLLASQLRKPSGFFKTLSSESSSEAKRYTYNGKYDKSFSLANKAFHYSLNEELMAKDLDATHTCLERLLEGQGFTDDIDNLKNRFIRTSGKLLQQQFELGLFRLNEVIMPLLGNLLPSASDSSINKVNRVVKNQLRTNNEDVTHYSEPEGMASEEKASGKQSRGTPTESGSTTDRFAYEGVAGSLSKELPVMVQRQSLYRSVPNYDLTNNKETKWKKSHKRKGPNVLRYTSSQLLTNEVFNAGISYVKQNNYPITSNLSTSSINTDSVRFYTWLTSYPGEAQEMLVQSKNGGLAPYHSKTLIKKPYTFRFVHRQIKKLEGENLIYPIYRAKLNGLSLQSSKGFAKQAREFFAMQSYNHEQHVRRGGSLELSEKAKALFPKGEAPYQCKEEVSLIKNAPFRWLRTSKPINSAFREFFGSNPLSQYMDQTNPLAEITHKRRLSSMGPGGIKRETAGMEVRGIHPTHYGRVCPIETPEGKNAGLVNSPTVYGRVGNSGFLETPLYEVIENQVQTKRWAFFSAQHEEKALRGKALATCDTGLLQFNFLSHLPIPVQTANNPLTHFQQVERYRVGYRSLSPIQTISIATALIPFLEHDDANRALMGSNMQRQAIPLLSPERPIVGTGFEPLVVMESGQALQATKLGCVFQADANSIIVHTRCSREKPLFLVKQGFTEQSTTQIKPNVLENFRFTALPWSKALVRRFGTKYIVGNENLSFSLVKQSGSRLPIIPSSQRKGLTSLTSKMLVQSKHKMLEARSGQQSTRGGTGACFAKAPSNSKGLKLLLQYSKGITSFFNIEDVTNVNDREPAPPCFANISTLLGSASETKLTSFPCKAKDTKQMLGQDVSEVLPKGVTSSMLEMLVRSKKEMLAKQYPCSLLTSFNREPLFCSAKPSETNDKMLAEQEEMHISSSHNTFLLQPLKQDLQFYERSNQETCLNQRPLVQEGDWIQKGDFLADSSASHSGDLALGKNVTVAYMPWEGYNFEDAIVISDRLVSDDIYTSLHIERYEIKVSKNSQGKERITNRVPGTSHSLKHLDNFGIARISSWVQPGDILVGKVVELKRPLSPYERLAWELASRLSPKSPEREKWLNKVWLEDISLRLPSGICGRVINSQIISTEYASMSAAQTSYPKEMLVPSKKEDLSLCSARGTQNKEQAIYPQEVHIYLAIKRKIQIGDKLAGRHGNKGIVSAILPQEDMPYLGDGSCIDMVLNPLGVPSRMNLGQIFECLLGLAGSQLGCNFRITPFDEIAGGEASRSLVFLKLYQCRLMYKQQWLFTPTFPGKSKLFDGRTGEPFENWVTVGQAYMLKLIHMVDHKIHARSTGPYSLFTRQPVRGRSRRGGQRLGEMEVWAVEGFGAAYTLQEFLTIKSDDLKARTALQKGFYKQNDVTFGKIHIAPGNPEAFKVLISELQALCLHIQM